jgi:hypothetical protein
MVLETVRSDVDLAGWHAGVTAGLPSHGMQDPLPPQPPSPTHAEPAVEKWVWKLFTGEAYPYIRRTLRQQHGRPPTPEEIKGKFFEVYPRCTVKIMVMELVGLGLEFQDLATYPYGAGEFSRLMADPIGYLSHAHGGGKFKLSFYDGEQFFATQNFKVGGRPKWNMLKCLLSVIEAMEEKNRDAPSPAASFSQLRNRLCAKLGLTPDTVTTEKSDFLRLIRLTAGNQYEDYLSILLNVQDSSELVAWIIHQLDDLYARRSPLAKGDLSER